MSDYIDYDQLYIFLNKKFKATHAELRYWIKDALIRYRLHWNPDTCIIPFSTDISKLSKFIEADYFYPECYYYIKKELEIYIPTPHERFVTVSDLVIARNWIETSDTSRFTILRKAAQMGLLRYYDRDNDLFTYYYDVKLGGETSRKKWHETEFMQNHLEDPNSFFLLEDILKIERYFFKKPLELCEAELGIEKKDL